MAIWDYYQRIFYSSGTLDFRYFPTLPIVYYLQLCTYSFYVLLLHSGFQDTLLFYQTTYAIEGVFLKLPMIIADLGTFLLFVRSTKLLTATLYFLNPFMIYLSAAWGTYDSIMIFFLVAGFIALQRDRQFLSTMAFSISGLVKLFGLVPLSLLVIDNALHRRFRTLFLQLGIAGLITLIVLAPIPLQGSASNLFSGFALRFLGLSGAQTASYNIFTATQGSKFGGAPPYIWLAYLTIPIAFVYKTRKTTALFLPLLQLSLIGAILLNLLSQAEPQWLSWPIPLALIYGSATKRTGLGFYSYSFGAFATFLSITLTQGVGYLLFGLPYTAYLAPFEGFSGTLLVYATTTLSLLLLIMVYVFRERVTFKLETLALIFIIYAQAYFWFSIVRIQDLW